MACRVSVVIPNHNHATELVTALGALAAQTVAPDEVVLIDDASTDDSAAVIARYRDSIGNLKVLQNPERLGVARAVQRGIEAACGDYILLASADERLLPEACAELRAAADRCPGAKLIVSQYTGWHPEKDIVHVHDRDSEHGMWYVHQPDGRFFAPGDLVDLLQERFVWLAANTALIDRKALLEVGGFDEKLRWHSDWFALYAIAFRYGFYAIPRSLAWFRVSTESYSGRGMRNGKAQRQVALEIQRKLRSAAFRDVDARVMRAPVAMSTFMRATLLALALRPPWYGRLARLLVWWTGQVLCGRRPAAWARLWRRADGDVEGQSARACGKQGQ